MLTRKLPSPGIGLEKLSSRSFSRVSIWAGFNISSQIFLHCSASIAWGFTGVGLPWILIVIGEPAEMKMSEAFFSAISCRSFSMNMCVYPLPGLPQGGGECLVAPQELVDSRLGAGLGVDLLDDDRAIETIPAIPPRQGARNDYGAGGNPPV